MKRGITLDLSIRFLAVDLDRVPTHSEYFRFCHCYPANDDSLDV